MNKTKRITSVAAAVGVAALCATALADSADAAQTRAVPKCSASHLSAKQTSTSGGMSQPASFITVTNMSGASCVLKGYPTIKSASTKKGKQSIAVGHETLMNAPEVKATRIVLAPGGHAWFAIGGATAYDPPVVNFVSITFATSKSGDTATSKLTLQATAPSGKPFPLNVTAFAPGVGNGGDN